MKRFNYKARDKTGTVLTGEVEATSPEHASKLLHTKGLVIISIKAKIDTPLDIVRRFRERITLQDVATFTRQLSTMVNAGLPITEALLILRSQAKGPMEKITSQVMADVEGGESFSTSISRHPKVFSPTYVALVRSGEVGGVLDDVLARLADDLEKQQEFTGKVKGALIYPAIVISGMLVVGLIMMIFVVPRLTSLYGEFDANLPAPTKILIGISNILLRFWPIFLVLAIGGFYGFGLYRKTVPGRRRTDELILKLPIIGDLQRQVLLTDITRTLSLMVGAGVSILDALNITAGVVSNVVLSEALKDAAKQVEKGFPVAYSFAKHPEAFPFILSQMIAVGEETGKMEDVLKKISHVFEVESDQRVKTLTAAIEPLVMILLGVGVGFLVIAVILPIYNLTSQF